MTDYRKYIIWRYIYIYTYIYRYIYIYTINTDISKHIKCSMRGTAPELFCVSDFVNRHKKHFFMCCIMAQVITVNPQHLLTRPEQIPKHCNGGGFHAEPRRGQSHTTQDPSPFYSILAVLITALQSVQATRA